jgi:AraC family transcriptional regulator of adaptative response/methylated-DNA-[protein]-cysteine methyltransferase
MNAPALSAQWKAVLARDASADGRFVYAVRSTGIYCRPTCPSRKPSRGQVLFFPAPDQAEHAGFRACLRCKPRSLPEAVLLARGVCAALAGENLGLSALSRRFGVSPSHLQRVFKRVVGISPRQYAQERRMERFRGELKEANTVTDAIYGAGFGSSSRLYEGWKQGLPPGALRRGAVGERITWATSPCALGRVLVARTERGLCAISLGESEDALREHLRRDFPGAELSQDEKGLRSALRAVVQHAEQGVRLDLPLDVRATAFQRRVWDALRAIPRGETRSYGELARALGTGPRAVARACATNRLALAIPCHRAVRKDGDLGGYRWGLERKSALLARERD